MLKKSLYILLFVSLILIAGFMLGRFLFLANASSVPIYIAASSTPIMEEPLITSGLKLSALRELSNEQYEDVKKEFLNLVDKKDPKEALADLRERTKVDNALLRSCHSISHEIGREAYKKYGSFGQAMKYQDEICNSGYFHGIIEAHFSKSKNIFADMRTVCDAYPIGKYLSWECFHGVGHGLMFYSYNDLSKSLELCETYSGSFAESVCADGVFMENFNTDEKLHKSEFVKENDPFYPCKEKSTKHKNSCYLYAPTYYLSINKNYYFDALAWCDGAESNYIDDCVKGVGSQALKNNIKTPKFVEEICMSGQRSKTMWCIEGMVGLSVNHYGSIDPALQMCEVLEEENKQTCFESVKSASRLF